jgi:hypothetical protein
VRERRWQYLVTTGTGMHRAEVPSSNAREQEICSAPFRGSARGGPVVIQGWRGWIPVREVGFDQVRTVDGASENVSMPAPVVHTLFAGTKVPINGTFHGGSGRRQGHHRGRGGHGVGGEGAELTEQILLGVIGFHRAHSPWLLPSIHWAAW